MENYQICNLISGIYSCLVDKHENGDIALNWLLEDAKRNGADEHILNHIECVFGQTYQTLPGYPFQDNIFGIYQDMMYYMNK